MVDNGLGCRGEKQMKIRKAEGRKTLRLMWESEGTDKEGGGGKEEIRCRKGQ